ncbi:acetylornithine transaminase [Salipaludibacillus aurantiacus]|uniref:Acetylornithine aminotransferase n=1 Tax=Salipaludibacillus aurantiacus TaxID=1601833 RepID=A0A1H9VSH0_9BACI|nr:acetylornithine transaminase [Salipaludibacillus aurantiacus]SES24615.1 acetylornithine aminotransferase [Salipaludibacillus aurantiacus]
MLDLSAQKISPVMETYGRFPITLVKGKGSYVWDEQGNKYLDYTSGIATCNLGHIPEAVSEKLKNQLDHLWHCSNLYHIPSQNELAEKLTSLSCHDQVFFCNSGAEANEAAVKLAKKYAKDQGYTNKTDIVTFTDSFHGRTGTTMAATAQQKIHEGFTPLTPGFSYLPFNDQEALLTLDEQKTCAVMLELVQGEGGVRPADVSWVKQLSKICKEKDILLIIDEVQTGIGRTGTLFAYEQFGIKPDVMTLAKGLGSGIPVGAMLAKESVGQSFKPGTHGSTFGGNPLAMTAALATIETVEKSDFLKKAEKQSHYLFDELKKLETQYSLVKEVRGKGFLVGVELNGDAKHIVKALHGKGILSLIAGPAVLRVLPPLNTTEDEINHFLSLLKDVLNEQEDAS